MHKAQAFSALPPPPRVEGLMSATNGVVAGPDSFEKHLFPSRAAGFIFLK